MRVIVSGISGSGRSDAVADLKDYLRKNYPKKKLVVMTTNRLMWSTARELRIDVKREKMLDLSPPTLQSLQSAVFERIIREVEEYEKTVTGDFDPYTCQLNEIGRHLIKLRIWRGLSQTELANKLGIKPTQVSRDERFEYSPEETADTFAGPPVVGDPVEP